jgi:hypothetical protein
MVPTAGRAHRTWAHREHLAPSGTVRRVAIVRWWVVADDLEAVGDVRGVVDVKERDGRG